MVQDMLLHGRADGRLLDTHEKVAPSLETDQPGPWDGGGRELGIVVELQSVVCGVEYQGWGFDRGNPPVWQVSTARLMLGRKTGYYAIMFEFIV